jgi:two-component system NarL family sensor kinase
MSAAHPDTGDDRVLSALERERTRLADALHDGALQDLAVARQNYSEAREGDREALVALRDDLERLSEQLRTLTSGLHEETLAELPLAEALERIVRGIRLRGTPVVTVRVDADAAGEQDALVRQFVRELVANVARHADAATAEVAVQRDGDDLRVTVVDDGRGFDPEAAATPRPAGHPRPAPNPRSIRELGGSFEIAATTPRGSRAVAVFPA